MELLTPGVTRFGINETSFIVDIAFGNKRRPSDNEAFTIVKTTEFLNLYIGLSKKFRPRTILELGVFQGGGFVFLDSVFKPNIMSAVELSSTPVAPLQEWLQARPSRTVHYGHSQTDAELLQRIVKTEFDGALDMVVDDASHCYEECRRSFEILFPRLSPGGYYVLEDWSWSHENRYQGENAPLADRHSLTNLIFDIVMLSGSTSWVEDLHLARLYAVVRKSLTPVQIPADLWGSIKTRGKTLSRL